MTTSLLYRLRFLSDLTEGPAGKPLFVYTDVEQPQKEPPRYRSRLATWDGELRLLTQGEAKAPFWRGNHIYFTRKVDKASQLSRLPLLGGEVKYKRSRRTRAVVRSQRAIKSLFFGYMRCSLMRGLAGVNYSHPDWHKEVRRLTGGKGADAVVDHTGAQYWEGVIKATAWGGRISLAGASSGYEAITPLLHIFYRQLSIFGSTMASKSRLFPILKFVEARQLVPVVGATLPLGQAAEGHRLLETRSVFGKVVLEV